MSLPITFTDLPFDCLYIIYSYLTGNDIISLRKVCTYLAEVASYYGGNKSEMVYMSRSNFAYGFYNNLLLSDVKMSNLSSMHNITCLFDVKDICNYNGGGRLTVRGKAYNSGVVEIDEIHSKVSHFTDINNNFLHVKKLYMSKNNTVKNIKGLHNMTTLRVTDNKHVLDSVSGMKSLTYLDISKTGCKIVRYLPSLKTLICNNNTRVDFGTLPELEHFELIRVDKYRIIDITPFSNLKVLNLSKCSYVPMKSISKIKTLVELNLSRTNVYDVSKLGHIKKLNLNSTDVDDISALTEVEELNISYTYVTRLPVNNKIRILKAKGFKGTRLDNIENVVELNAYSSLIVTISHNNILERVNLRYSENFEDIDALRNATYVDVSITSVRSIPIPNSMKEVDLFDNPIESLEGLENAEVVNAGNTHIIELPNFTCIRRLTIGGSDIYTIPHYPTLRNLVIWGTKVTDINHLTGLTSLHITKTMIDDISKLVNLTNLYIYKCGIKDISNLTKLVKLHSKSTPIISVNKLVNLETLSTDIEELIDLPNLITAEAGSVVQTNRMKVYDAFNN